jgi:type I site-specific restriction endonuclease
VGIAGAFLEEARTRSRLIDPALYARGWTEELIRREETLEAVELVLPEGSHGNRGPRSTALDG